MVCNTAVFYDIENLICLFSVKNNTILQLDEIYRRILEVEGVNGVSVQKAYADWAVQINRNLRNYVLQIGIEPVQIFNTNQNDKVKNAADVSLIIDAVELLAKRPDIENYVIVSGDGIFAFLAKKLHEHGKRVIGCGFNRNTNIIFRNACDYFVSLEKTDKTLTATSNKSALTGPSQATLASQVTHHEEAPVNVLIAPETQIAKPAPVVAQPTPVAAVAKQQPTKKVPRKFPKNKFSETLAHSDLAVLKDAADTNATLLVIRDMVNVLFGKDTDEAADLEISVFKTYVDYYVQGFRMSQFKFKRFGEFVRFILSGSPFCLYSATAEGTTLKIARRGTSGVKGSVMADMRGLQVTLQDGSITNSIFNVPEHSEFTYTIVDLIKPTLKQEPKPQRNARRDAKFEKPVKKTEPATETPTEAPSNVQVLVDELEPVVQPDLNETASPADTENPSPESSIEAEGDDNSPEGSVRKWIKANFMRLSLDNALSTSEVRRLTTAEYSQKTFGVKTPVLKESLTRSNLREQRTVNGKVKYWKELFKYNGKTYLVYKEWIASLHQERFSAWFKKVESKTKTES